MKNNIFIYILFFFSLQIKFITPCYSQNYNWEQIGPGAGGQILGIWFNDSFPNHVYLGSDVAGLWRSKDKGASWEYLTKGWQPRKCQDLFIDPRNSKHLFISLYGGIYHSTNNGNTWSSYCTSLPSSVQYSDIDGAYNSLNELVLYVGTGEIRNDEGGNGRVYKIKNNKMTVLLPGMENSRKAIYSVIVNKSDPSKVWISTGCGIFHSANEGESWTDKTGNLPTGKCRKLITNPASFYELIVTTYDSGLFYKASNSVNWKSISGLNNGLPKENGLNSVLCKHQPPFGKYLFAGFDLPENIYRTTSGTTHPVVWENISKVLDFGWNSSNKPATNPSSLALSPKGDLWCGSNGNFFKSLENDNFFEQQYCTLVNKIEAETLPVNKSGAAYATSTWNHRGMCNMFVRDIEIDPKNPGRIFISNADRNVFASEDTGKSWRQLNFYLMDRGVKRTHGAFFIRFNPYSKGAKTVYASSGLGFGSLKGIGGLFKSTDGGKTWFLTGGGAFKKGGLPDAEIWDITFTRNNKIYAAVKGKGIYKSLDAGKTWSVLAILKDHNVIEIKAKPNADNVLYVGCASSSKGKKGLFKLLLKKEGWVIEKSFTDYECWDIAVDPRRPYLVYSAMSTGGIWKIDDTNSLWMMKNITSSRSYLDVTGKITKALTVDTTNGTLYASFEGDLFSKSKLLCTANDSDWKDISQGLYCPFGWSIKIGYGSDIKSLYVSNHGHGVFKANLTNELPSKKSFMQNLDLAAQDMDDGITIYPNPSSGYFRLNIHNKTWKEPDIILLDETGKIILRKNIIVDNEPTLELSILPKGIYYVLITETNKSIRRTVIIE